MMQPFTANQERLDPSFVNAQGISTATIKNNAHKHAVFLDEDALANSEPRSWPPRDSTISVTPALTGSFQPEHQVLPHMKIKVKWPLAMNKAETVFTRGCVQAASHTAEVQFYPGKFDCFFADLTSEQLHHVQRHIWGSKATAGLIIKFVRRPEYPARDYLFRVNWPVPTMESAFADTVTEKFRGIAYQKTLTIMIPRVRSRWIDSQADSIRGQQMPRLLEPLWTSDRPEPIAKLPPRISAAGEFLDFHSFSMHFGFSEVLDHWYIARQADHIRRMPVTAFFVRRDGSDVEYIACFKIGRSWKEHYKAAFTEPGQDVETTFWGPGHEFQSH